MTSLILNICSSSTLFVGFVKNKSELVYTTEFKAVLPRVTNISLSPLFSSGLLTAKSKIAPDSNGVYKIEKAGFYVLSFNTTVDAEQMPIKKLSVRIKQNSPSDTWDNEKSVISLYNIDPMPDSNNPHKIVRYLQAGDYYVLIKLEDNWGFYQCLGHPNSTFSDSNCCQKSEVFYHPSCIGL